MTTPILSIEEIAEGQNDKEVTANDAFNALEQATNGWNSFDLSGGNVSLTAGANLTTYLRSALVKTTGNAVARDLTLPARKRMVCVWNAGSATLSVKVGSTTVSVAAGVIVLLHVDGTTNGVTLVASSAAAGAQPYDIPVMCLTTSPTATERLLLFVATRALTFAANLAGSYGRAQTTATNSAAFDVQKNGSTVGTVTFGVGANTPTFATSGGNPFSLAAGDYLEVFAPGTPDATLKNFSFTLVGAR